MAKYSNASQDKVAEVMHEMKEGTLKSGKSGRKVINPKQAIAIGLSEARELGDKVPAQKNATGKKTAAKKAVPKKETAKKTAARK